MPKSKITKPLVAIITRTRDRPLFLARCLESVYAQTMPDFVHVIVNDGGDRKAFDAVLKPYESKIKGRAQIIHQPHSGGMDPMLNAAIRSVDSTFIAVHDDDDTWHPDFLRLTTEHLERAGSMGVVVTTDRVKEEVVDDTIRVLQTDPWRPEVTEISLARQCLDNQMTPITFVYRREVFKTIGYYDESLPVIGDWDFGLRFLRHFDIDFLKTETALARYHHRPTTTGVMGNSVFAGRDEHNYHTNRLRNKYLRQDLDAGVFGIGVLMNLLAANREQAAAQLAKLDMSVGRVNEHLGDLINRSTVIGRVRRLRTGRPKV